MITIKSKQNLFRRCGIAHPKDSTSYPDGRFTKQELAILQAEPMLTVEVISEKTAAPPEVDQSDPPPSAKADEAGKEPVKSGKKGKR